MKQLIGLIRLSVLKAGSVVAHRKTLAIKIPDRQLPREGELVLLDIDGTVVAREIDLARHSGCGCSVHLGKVDDPRRTAPRAIWRGECHVARRVS